MRAIPHRPCDQTPALRAAGMTYFPAPGQPWPGVGPAERLARPLPGDVTHCSAREPVRGSWRSVTPWHPSPGWPLGQRACSSWANTSIPGSSWWRGAGDQDSVLVAQELERWSGWGAWERGLGATASFFSCWWVEASL